MSSLFWKNKINPVNPACPVGQQIVLGSKNNFFSPFRPICAQKNVHAAQKNVHSSPHIFLNLNDIRMLVSGTLVAF